MSIECTMLAVHLKGATLAAAAGKQKGQGPQLQELACCRAPSLLLLASGPASSTMVLPAAQLLGSPLLRPLLMGLSGLSVEALLWRPLLDEVGQRLCWRCERAAGLLAEGESAAGAGARPHGESALRLCWGEAGWAGVRC